MGTRSLTVVRDTEGAKDICVLYRQMDGYPTGHGAELKEFLAPFTVVNGIGSDTPKKAANGMECLAAQLVSHFKGDQIGSFYLYPSGTRDCGEEYIYTVYKRKREGKSTEIEQPEPVMLKVQSGCVTYFGLPGTKQGNMPVIYNGLASEFDPEAAEKVRDEQPAPVNDWADKQSLKKQKVSKKAKEV